MFENFSTNAISIIDDALQIARSLNKPLVGSEHLLLAMYQRKDTICHFLLKEKNIEYQDILNIINNLVILRKSDSTNLTYSKKFQEIILYSETLAKDLGSKYVYDEHIFYVMLKEYDSIACVILEKLGLDIEDLMIDIEEIFNFFEDEIASTKQDDPPFSFLTNLSTTKKVHPFIKRSNYIDKIKYILSKKQKNNPLLIGRAGVGKTAIVEGLSEILKEETIYQLDLGSIVSGTKYRGELEEKITKAMDYIRSKKAIVFIDEIHNIVGAGSNDGSLDIANILKPYLSRSDIKLIGSTTLDEYYRFIEKDKALTRRFQNVFIEEPTTDETYEILRGIKRSYEDYHQIKYSDRHLKKIIDNAKLYLINKSFPDKAIDILDEVGARKKSSNKTIEKLIDEVTLDIAGIKNPSVSALKKANLYYPHLKNNYLKFIKRYELDCKLNNIGVIDVEENFDPEQLIIDLDKVFNFKKEMYLEIDLEGYHDMVMLNNLIGSSKGYVGYDEGGILSEHIIRYPMSLIYLKNFGKAHINIQNYFKSLFKKSFFTDNKSRRIDLINTLFIVSKNSRKSGITGFISDKNQQILSSQLLLKNIKKGTNISNILKIIKKYQISIQNLEKIPTEKVNDIIIEAIINGKKEYTYDINTDKLIVIKD